jgi:hypothetical protein
VSSDNENVQNMIPESMIIDKKLAEEIKPLKRSTKVPPRDYSMEKS